ncbi:MAG: acetylxylan esterase, partial [Clostridia bacterium]|nr:acetylxylan esterase [Clostridia bacterium]
YFRTMIMRDIQAVRFIKAYVGTEGVMINGEKKALGIWNGELRTYGGSQGGFQGIAISALDKDVTDAFWASPWLCDVAGMRSVFRPQYTDDFRYFDSIYHARRVRENVNVHIISGLGDYVCPPSGVVALYNALKASATLEFYQGMTHTYDSEKGPLTKYHK